MSSNPLPDRRLLRGLDSLWYVAGAPQALIVLAVVLAVIVALAAVFPQLPAGMDPLASQRWLDATALSYGDAGAFLAALGIFDILSGPWTVILLALLAFHLSLRVADQLSHLLRRRTYRRSSTIPPTPPALPYEAWRFGRPLAAASSSVKHVLQDWKGLNRLQDRGAGETPESSTGAAPVGNPGEPIGVDQHEQCATLFAERRSWAAAGPLLGYLGPLIVIVGLLVNGIFGWRAADIPLATGETAAPSLARGTAVTLSAAGEGVAQLTLARGELTRQVFVAAGAPGRWENLWASQRSTGTSLTVEAKDEEGRPAPLQALNAAAPASGSLHLRFSQAESEQAFTSNEQGLIFRVVSYSALPDRGIDRPVFFVEGYQGDNPVPGLTWLVEDASDVEWAGLRLALRRDRYVVIDLASLPGLPLLLIGGLLTLAGAVLALWFGNSRVWVDLTGSPEGSIVAVRAAGPALPQETAARVLSQLPGASEAEPPGPSTDPAFAPGESPHAP